MTTHDENYPGPVRLRGKPGKRVRWGRKELDTGLAIIAHMQQVTPPLVVPCMPGRMEKIKDDLRHCGVRAKDGDLRDMLALSTGAVTVDIGKLRERMSMILRGWGLVAPSADDEPWIVRNRVAAEPLMRTPPCPPYRDSGVIDHA